METKAPALKPGDTIGVMSTSCWVGQEDLDRAKAFLEAKGYKVYIHPQATARLHQSAGDAQGKADAFHDLITNPDIKAIFGSRGGNRALTMLDKINFSEVAANPKIIVGYSDLTVLLNSIYNETGLITFHGPLFRELPDRTEAELTQLLSLLEGKTPDIPFNDAEIIQEGAAEGPLIGGNLSLLQALSGTPHQPDTDGAILFIEDIGDHISRYDRMLAHMKLAGWFNRISGVIIGSFSNTKDDEDRPFGFSLEDVVREHFKGTDIPIVCGAPFGHRDTLYTLPVGGKARLEAKDGKITFKLLAPAVAP
ncbi:MAG: LD-carboxypeptidase [Rhodospirillales bacterium]|nr:LD-carboxypeptidase [Rhodospirillales bacterium]MCB9995918.1 LD-carboxypeptidase [Rhodospirillales bacterium]